MKNVKNKKVCIVGGGMGSISSAVYLKKKGFDVSIYEKNSTLGGRANIIKESGFKFDVGPSLLNYPWIFENLFDEAGEKMEDHIDLIEIKSGVKFLWDDKETFSITSDFPRLSNEIARLENSHINGLNTFLKVNSQRYDIAFEKLLNRNLDNPIGWGTGLGAKELFSGSMFRSMYNDLGKHFKSKYIKEAFGSYAMYLGGSPFKIPGFFSILPYGEIAYGLWMPKGGIYSLIEKLEEILIKIGVKIFKETAVKEILIKNNNVEGIVINNGEFKQFNTIVSNVDLPTTESKLIKGIKFNSFEKKQMTPSVMTFYWGLNKKTDFPHHMIFLPNDYKECFEDLFSKKLIPSGMPFYTSSPSVSDKTLAPSGKSTLFALVPLPVTDDDDVNEFSNLTKEIKNKIFERFNYHGIDLSPENIEFEKIYSPDKWRELYGLYKTSAFGASHNLFNIGPFRNRNKSSKVNGLYYVGASTTPGTGLPMVTLSGKLVSERILSDIS